MTPTTTHEAIEQFFNIAIGGKTVIDIRNTNRETLTQFFGHMHYTTGVEIGVERGEFSETIMKNLPRAVKVYGVDPWEAYKGYREHVSQSKLDTFYQSTIERMAIFPQWEPIRGYSHMVATTFPDNTFDFVYLDGNHDFFNVTRDLHAWTPKVKPGGIIAGHDFRRISSRGYNCHVVDVVHAWTHAHEIRPWFVLGAKDKVEGELRDKSRSFFWVKQ